MIENVEPFVSVVIPMYNAESYISETIQSVLKQSYKKWELIIVDDGSTDQSVSRVISYDQMDSRIHLIRLDRPSGGPAGPRNVGVHASKGDFIAFLDADDVWLPHKLETQLRSFEENPALNAVAANAYIYPKLHGNSLLLFRNKTIKYHNLLSYPLGVLGKTYIINSSVLMRKSIFLELGGLDESSQLVASEDYDLWLRILKSYDGSIFVIKECLLQYRIHGNNLTGLSERSIQIFNRLDMIYNKHEHPTVQILKKRLAKVQEVHRFKIYYYSGKLTMLQFLKTEIDLMSKMRILASKFLRMLHG